MSAPSTPAHGFGSFHTERDEDRIDVLISLPDEKYTPPVLPFSIDLSQFPIPTLPPPELLAVPGDDWENDITWHLANNSTPFDDSVDDSQQEQQEQQQQSILFGRQTLSNWFHIDPNYTFINHGAFGATMKPVSKAESLWHIYMESQPLRFIDRKLLPLLVYTTRNLAKFINVPATDLVILPNVTNGLNTVLNSIDWYFKPQSVNNDCDQQDNTTTTATPTIPATPATTTITTTITTLPTYVLTFDTGYGATKQMIKSIIDKHGNHITHQEMKLIFPISNPKEITQLLRHTLRKHEKFGTINQIKLIIIDYIQSNSALVFPIEDLIALCNQYNIPVMIDGAHSLGSFNLDINNMKHKPTFFLANAHKWLCSGKGVSLLYVNPDKYPHKLIKPAVVSHGYSSETLAGKFLWIGLQDYCHYLALNSTLDSWKVIGASNIRTYLNTMIINISQFLTKVWNTDLLGPIDMFNMMVCIRLPGNRVPKDGKEHTDLQDLLYFKYNIEAPIKMLQNRLYIRISCHIYNDWSDFKRLAKAMLELRPKLVGDDDENDQTYAESAEAVTPMTSCG